MTKVLTIVTSCFLFGVECYFNDNFSSNDVSLLLESGNGPPPSAPPPLGKESSLASCSCKRLLLSSLGPAAQDLPQTMGIYELSVQPGIESQCNVLFSVPTRATTTGRRTGRTRGRTSGCTTFLTAGWWGTREELPLATSTTETPPSCVPTPSRPPGSTTAPRGTPGTKTTLSSSGVRTEINSRLCISGMWSKFLHWLHDED